MADSDTTQQVDIKKLLAEMKALIANCGLKRAVRGAEDHEKALAEANSQLKKRETHEKLLAEMKAFIANCRQKRAEREAEDREKALAEAKALIANSQLEREAREKALAEANALIANSRAEREANAIANGRLKQADAPSAGPFLTTSQWLLAIGLGASLVARPFYGKLLPN